jgi:hypothetical protein
MLGLIVVCVVVAHAVIGYQGWIADHSTVRCPVFDTENVMIGYSSVNDHKGSTVENVIHKRFIENDGFRSILSMFDGLEALCDGPIRENCPCGDSVICVPRSIGKIPRFVALEDTHDYIPLNILGWSFAGIYKQGGNEKWFAERERDVSWNEGKSNPSAFVAAKVPICIYDRILSGFCSLSHLAQLTPVDEDGCNSYYAEAKLEPKGSVMDRMKFFHRFSGCLFFLVGFGFAAIGHYPLYYQWGIWSWRKRLMIGISGWSLAIVFIWHGASILLNI